MTASREKAHADGPLGFVLPTLRVLGNWSHSSMVASPRESDENKFLHDAMDVGTRNRQLSGQTAPQEPTTAGDLGTERHNFLLRVGAEAVERRGIDGRHLRT